MKCKFIIGAVYLAAALSVQAEEPPKYDGWTFLTGSDQLYEYGKLGSGELVKGVRSFLIQLVPTPQNQNKSVVFMKFTISEHDCNIGYGLIKGYNLSGKLMNTYDYVKGGGNLATYAADMLCSVEFNKQ